MSAMVTRLAMVLVLLLAMSGTCLAAAKGVLAEGFGAVAWGEDVGRRDGFMKLRSQDGIDYYVNLRERFEFKGYGKPTVFYGQAGGRLYAVHLRLKDGSGYDKLLAELRKIYGKGKLAKSDDGEVASWRTGPVRVKLKRDQDGAVKLSFYYQPVAVTLDALQADADPSAEDLARMLPPGTPQVKSPSSAAPASQEEYVGIDVLKYLREGEKLLKVDIPRYRKNTQQ